jgi:hypothetical protein
MALSPVQTHNLQFTTARTASSQPAVPSPVIWYRLPTADVPLPGFPNCPRATATTILGSQCTQLLQFSAVL